MRLLLLSDIHAHDAALRRVLAHAAGRFEAAVVLGDVVGYGPDPVAALERVRALPLRACVEGNHEAMLRRALAGEPIAASPAVASALERHARLLDHDHIRFLASFAPEHVEAGWHAVHGSPKERFAYLVSVPDARASEPHMRRDVVFVGHTHVPAAYLKEPGGQWKVVPVRGGSRTLTLPCGARAFVNPGSVGPARDFGGGAAYAVFDEDARTVEFFRGI